jgi:hypothetical protein
MGIFCFRKANFIIQKSDSRVLCFTPRYYFSAALQNNRCGVTLPPPFN